MTLHPRTTRIALAVGALLVVTAIAVAAVVYALVRNSGDRPVEITAYAHGHTAQVTPYRYCTIDLAACTDGPTVDLAVPPDGRLQLSLPHDIAAGPWNLYTVRQATDGSVVTDDRWYRTGEAAAVTIESHPDLQLIGVEIKQPSAAVDENGQYFRGIWSIKTA